MTDIKRAVFDVVVWNAIMRSRNIPEFLTMMLRESVGKQ